MRSADGKQIASRGIHREVARLQEAGQRAALASPARISGSVPCVSQSRMLIREDGSLSGTIGGGPLEAEVLRRAHEVMASGRPIVAEFELRQDDAAEAGMICGGSCSVLIEPVLPGRSTEAFCAAARAEAEGKQIVLVTTLPEDRPYSKLALLRNGVMVGSTGDAGIDAALREVAERRWSSQEPLLIDEPLRACIQPICPAPPLYVFGAGHVAVHVAHLAALVGFRVTIIDDRAEFASPARFPEADEIVTTTVPEAFAELPIGEGAYVVSITRGHKLDEEVVAHALRTPAKYIGMIGSRSKLAAVRQRLLDRGFSEADLTRIHAPIGIDIGAETVEEIALSIAAELVAVRRGQPS